MVVGEDDFVEVEDVVAVLRFLFEPEVDFFDLALADDVPGAAVSTGGALRLDVSKDRCCCRMSSSMRRNS